MAAATTYSSRFTTAGVPVSGRPFTAPVGLCADTVSDTVPTTSLDDIGDFRGLLPLPSGKTLVLLGYKNGDLDSGGGAALDGDLVLRQTDKNGNNTDTVVADLSVLGALSAANTSFIWTVPDQFISGSADADDVVVLGLKILAAASTAASGNLTVYAQWR